MRWITVVFTAGFSTTETNWSSIWLSLTPLNVSAAISSLSKSLDRGDAHIPATIHF